MNYIKELRTAEGWSMQQLADRCVPPTSASQINKLEKGRIKLTQQWMQRIADALGCHPLDILDGGPERLRPRERELVDMFRGLSDDRQDAVFETTTALAARGGAPTVEVIDEDGTMLYRGPERRVSGSDDGYRGPERRRPTRVRRI